MKYGWEKFQMDLRLAFILFTAQSKRLLISGELQI